MLCRLAAALLLSAGLRGCLVYEYEQEFWIKTDGSGTVYVVGRPTLWTAFKGPGAPDASDLERGTFPEAARRYFEAAGLRVNRVLLTHRRGQAYLFVSADFDDLNRLSASGAFPDLDIALRREGRRLHLVGSWARPRGAGETPPPPREGLIAIRFHLPSKVYEHENAVGGVERGNILSWRETVERALGGEPLAFGAVMDDRSILFSTVALFGGAILLALVLLASVFYFVARRGREALVADSGREGRPAVRP
jgi:hypothetical protein